MHQYINITIISSSQPATTVYNLAASQTKKLYVNSANCNFKGLVQTVVVLAFLKKMFHRYKEECL